MRCEHQNLPAYHTKQQLKHIFLLTTSLLLNVGYMGRKIFIIDSFPLQLVLFLKLRVLMRKPLRYLVPPQIELARAIREIEDRWGVFRRNLLGNSEGTMTWSRDGAAGLVTEQ